MEFLEKVYLGNSVRTLLVGAGVALAVFLASLLVTGALVRGRIARLVARTHTNIDDVVLKILASTKRILLFVISLWVGSRFIAVPLDRQGALRTAAVVALLLQIGFWAQVAMTLWLERVRRAKAAAGDTSSLGAMAMLGLAGRLAIWSVITLLVLDNLGVDITALVAGLGIGGIAVALAVQRILGDLLASVSIVLDKPFELGDVIAVGELTGTVQHIGIKTTRLKSVSGEQLVFANGDLLAARIKNYKRMDDRRVAFQFGLAYDSTPASLERVPKLVEEIVTRQPGVRFDRAHLRALGETALNFEVVYFVDQPDVRLYLDAQHRINLELLQVLGQAGLSPTPFKPSA